MKQNLLQTTFRVLLAGSVFIFAPSLFAQEETEDDEEIETLSPFVVDAAEQAGYLATSTLAGTRIKTNLSDVGSAISVVTEEFMQDVSAVDNETLLSYVLGTEVGGTRGNFSGGISATNPRESGLFDNPNGNTRVRGLSSADNTRNFFLTDVPWDGYNVDRVDLQRGPNAILFGLGSPAGVINASTTQAVYDTFGKAELRFDEHASFRTSINYNREIIEDQFAVRVAGLFDRQKFQQDPAFEDDDRYYISAAYKPAFLNSDRMFFEIKGSYEHGEIESNRPRLVTPLDSFTPWWTPVAEGGLGKNTVNQFTDLSLIDTNVDTAFQATSRTFISQIQPVYGSNWINDGGLVKPRVSSLGGLDPDGDVIGTFVDKDGDGTPEEVTGQIYFDNQSRQVIPSSDQRALNFDFPFARDGFYEAATIQDPSIFNFYDLLLDGPNKRAFTDWDTFEFELTNTFFNNKIGYNIAYFNQSLDRFSYGVMGTPVATGFRLSLDYNEATFDTSPNPDLGRAFVVSEPTGFNNGTRVSDRDALRVQAFAEHDFRDTFENVLGNILGFHRLTGLYSEEGQQTDRRSFNLFNAGPEYYEDPTNVGPGDTGFFRPGITYYLSGDLRGLDSPAGANVGRMTDFIVPRSGTRQYVTFDTTWIADPSVNPSDPWFEPASRPPFVSQSTQSENPANYRGWTTKEVNIVSALDNEIVPGTNMTARDYLTTSGNLTDQDIESQVFVWQGYFWHDSIVGTYGYREDTADVWQFRAPGRPAEVPGPTTNDGDVRPEVYFFGTPDGNLDTVDTETTNWSVAVHLHRLLGPKFEDLWPVNLSLYYNEGENFQPLAGRFDAFGDPIPPPGGTTEDVSFLIATKDNKYSLRFTSYETQVKNQRTTGNISDMWRLQQTIFAPGRSEDNFRTGRWSTDNHPDPERLVNEIIPAWQQFELDLQSRFPKFVDAWVTGPWPPQDNSTGARPPSGFTFTEDAISEGTEIEFIANPMPNWRIAINASQTEARRSNVPGLAFLEVSEWVNDKIMNTPVGEMPVWWSASPGVRQNIYLPFRAQWLKLLALNGQPQPEIREWRVNAITNYTFRDGGLKGLGIGGAFRFEDDFAIDFPPVETPEGDITVDIENPFMADSEKTFDIWASYVFDITEDISWRVQLNVHDIFADDELIPINTDPFGNPQAVRINYGQSWTVTNTINF